MPNKYKTIRTITVTGTHVLTLYRVLQGVMRKAETTADVYEAQLLLERIQKQTKIPLPKEEGPGHA